MKCKRKGKCNQMLAFVMIMAMLLSPSLVYANEPAAESSRETISVNALPDDPLAESGDKNPAAETGQKTQKQGEDALEQKEGPRAETQPDDKEQMEDIQDEKDYIKDKYGLTRYSNLEIDGVAFVDGPNGIVCTSITDREGGSITFEPKTMTITVSNYHFIEDYPLEEHGYECDNVYIDDMPDLTIVLNGYSKMLSSDKSYSTKQSIRIDSTNCTIKGSGTLEADMTIGGGAYDMLTIEDCHLILSGLYDGLASDSITIRNAIVDIKTELSSAVLQGTLYVQGNVNIENSIVRLHATAEDDYRSFMQHYDCGEIGAPEKDPPVLGSDVRVVDAEGNPLFLRRLQFGGLANDPNFYYVYSRKEGNLADIIAMTDVSKTVNFISEGKAASEKRIEAAAAQISGLGEITLQSEETIKQVRAAYDALSDYEKSRLTNAAALTEAEQTYRQLYAQEQQRLAEEAKRKAEEAKKKAEAEEGARKKAELEAQQKQQGQAQSPATGQSAPDKQVTVAKKKYTIKTAKLKGVKSKKRKTLTVSWKADKSCSGYQISCSTSKRFTKGSTRNIYIKKKSTKTATLQKLKPGRIYYVRMREYRIIGGKKYFGKYSVVKRVRVKK